MRRVVFLDRDGVITEEVFCPSSGEWEAPMIPEDLVLKAGAVVALGQLLTLGYQLILVSNQAAFAKGKTTLESLWAVHGRFAALMEEKGIPFLEYNYSFSHPDGVVPNFSGPSVERKPSPYLLLLAQAKYRLQMSRCWMIGDRDSDIECGQAAGVSTIRIYASHATNTAGQIAPTHFAADLVEAVRLITAACAER